mgnify:CR=1 FL=1
MTFSFEEINPMLQDTMDGFETFNDRFSNVFDNFWKKSLSNLSNFPPCDIIKNSDTDYTIRLAVAGYNKDDLKISLKNNYLVIKGENKENKTKDVSYVHKGIATRQFEHVIYLSPSFNIRNASLNNGMLEINLESKQEENTQNIKID